MIRLAVVMFLAVPGLLLADVLHLTDGTRLEGELRRMNGFWQITDEAGQVTFVGEDRVRLIEITAPQRLEPDEAEARLAALRRTAPRLPEIELIVRRYERLIEQAEGTPAAAEARQDLTNWQQRQEQGFVRHAGRWIAPQEQAQLREEALAHASSARRLIQDGEFQQAEQALQKALELDPENVSALYLRGVMQYRQNQIVQARRSFESVRVQLPDHGPTLNNLALVLWRQNQPVAAMNHYDQAMLAAPRDRRVLDNVAEALRAMPRQFRDHAVTLRVSQRFAEQDAELQQDLAEQGLRRWGAVWVDEEEFQRLRQIEDDTRRRLDELAGEYDALETRLLRVDEDIEANRRSLRQIAATSYMRDAAGNLVLLAYPPLYYEILRDNDELERERSQLVIRLDNVRATARAVEQQLPAPRYAGTQQLIGAEGTPLVPPSEI